MSRICEEFGCLPPDAARALRAAPVGLIEDIMELRAYQRAKRAYDDMDRLTPKDRAVLLDDPAVQLVQETEFALAEEALKRRG